MGAILAKNLLSERTVVMVEVGQAAPDFELPDQNGEQVRLSELHGQKVVVYFYPKADTPGYYSSNHGHDRMPPFGIRQELRRENGGCSTRPSHG